MARDVPKGWTCPACGKPVTADQLAAIGWDVKDVGRWYVKGTCPACQEPIMFTKQGAFRLTNPGLVETYLNTSYAPPLRPTEPPPFKVIVRRKAR